MGCISYSACQLNLLLTVRQQRYILCVFADNTTPKRERNQETIVYYDEMITLPIVAEPPIWYYLANWAVYANFDK